MKRVREGDYVQIGTPDDGFIYKIIRVESVGCCQDIYRVFVRYIKASYQPYNKCYRCTKYVLNTCKFINLIRDPCKYTCILCSGASINKIPYLKGLLYDSTKK